MMNLLLGLYSYDTACKSHLKAFDPFKWLPQAVSPAPFIQLAIGGKREEGSPRKRDLLPFCWPRGAAPIRKEVRKISDHLPDHIMNFTNYELVYFSSSCPSLVLATVSPAELQQKLEKLLKLGDQLFCNMQINKQVWRTWKLASCFASEHDLEVFPSLQRDFVYCDLIVGVSQWEWRYQTGQQDTIPH